MKWVCKAEGLGPTVAIRLLGRVPTLSLDMSSGSLPKIEDLKMTEDYQTYKLGNFKLKSGGEIPDAFIAYKTLGDPSLPAVVYPTWYSGRECSTGSQDLPMLIPGYCSHLR